MNFKYLISAIVTIVVGIIISASILLFTVFNMGDSIQRLVIPKDKVITLTTTGKHTLYHEFKTTITNTYYHSDETLLENVDISVVNKKTGESVDIAPSMNSSYTIMEREGVSITSFNIDEPGDYIVKVNSENITEENPIVLSISDDSFIKGLLFGILGTIFTAIITTILTIILIVIGIVKRNKEHQNTSH